MKKLKLRLMRFFEEILEIIRLFLNKPSKPIRKDFKKKPLEERKNGSSIKRTTTKRKL